MAIKTNAESTFKNVGQAQIQSVFDHIIRPNVEKIEEMDFSITEESGEVENLDLTASQVDLPENGGPFDPRNDKYGQFGGNQSSLRINTEEFLENNKVWEIVKSYFPDATAEDLELLFYRIGRAGCSYTAGINTIFKQSLFFNEIEFYEKFGFAPYDLRTDPDTGKLYKVFNYELLLLDFVLYYNVNYNGFTSIEEIYGNAEEERKFHEGDAALDDEEFVRTGMGGSPGK